MRYATRAGPLVPSASPIPPPDSAKIDLFVEAKKTSNLGPRGHVFISRSDNREIEIEAQAQRTSGTSTKQLRALVLVVFELHSLFNAEPKLAGTQSEP
jgi:hypothetical protein